MRRKNAIQRAGLAGLLVGMISLMGGSQTARADVSVTLTVTIVEPTCSVTDAAGNSQMEIVFENVPLEQVNSLTQARRTKTIKVTCEGAAPVGKTLKMMLSPTSGGTLSYQGQTVLGTSMPGLGIGLVLGDDNTFLTPGETIPVSFVDVTQPSPTGTIQFGGVLVSEKSSTLTAGAFSAGVSVVATYL